MLVSVVLSPPLSKGGRELLGNQPSGEEPMIRGQGFRLSTALKAQNSHVLHLEL